MLEKLQSEIKFETKLLYFETFTFIVSAIYCAVLVLRFSGSATLSGADFKGFVAEFLWTLLTFSWWQRSHDIIKQNRKLIELLKHIEGDSVATGELK